MQPLKEALKIIGVILMILIAAYLIQQLDEAAAQYPIVHSI
jgi:hypothetical protein